LARQTNRAAGYFENSDYQLHGGNPAPQELEDDDPFYELNECHKVTFLDIENKLKDSLYSF